MEKRTMNTGTAWKLLLLGGIALAAIAMFLAWDRPAQERAEAASDAPEMDMFVSVGSTGCPGSSSADYCVPGGGNFTLAIRAVSIPDTGYFAAQTFIVFGTDLTYNIAASAGDEAAWPDCETGTVVRGQFDAESVNHGCLTGVIPPLPTSTHIGNLFELSFTCSEASSSTEIELLPEGDPFAGTSGAAYGEAGSGDTISAKVSNLVVDCIGPTPTPTNTPIPPTATFTASPTPTNTPTPLPPPSERPDVSVTKVDLADPVDSEAPIEYVVTVESIGLQTAEDVVVVDTLPAGSTFKSATSVDAVCSHDSGVVTCTVHDPMEPDDVITIDIVINAPVGEDALIDNVVTVSSSNEPFANTGNNKDTEQTLVLAPRADVTLEKVGDPTFVDGGEDVTYALIARNLGPHPAENVQIVDTLPEDATFVSATNPECGAPVAGEVTCTLGSLGVNQETTVEIVLTTPFVTRGTLMKNSAFISADNELFTQTGNNLATENTALIAPPPDLVVSKTDSQDPVLRLGFYSYEITIDNIGDGDALDVVVTDTLPTASVQTFAKFLRPGSFVSSVGASCAPLDAFVVECTIDEINVGEQVVVTLNVRAPTTLVDQTIQNNVTVSASDPDESPAGNNASENTDLKACYDVNGDLVVDLFNDIVLVIEHFGLSTGDPGFDVIYDFDGDGSVDLFNDILGVINHYAQDCALLL